ncbi:hypothetical protein DXG01_013410, partial [Tephrocybe rancida]
MQRVHPTQRQRTANNARPAPCPRPSPAVRSPSAAGARLTPERASAHPHATMSVHPRRPFALCGGAPHASAHPRTPPRRHVSASKPNTTAACTLAHCSRLTTRVTPTLRPPAPRRRGM